MMTICGGRATTPSELQRLPWNILIKNKAPKRKQVMKEVPYFPDYDDPFPPWSTGLNGAWRQAALRPKSVANSRCGIQVKCGWDYEPRFVRLNQSFQQEAESDARHLNPLSSFTCTTMQNLFCERRPPPSRPRSSSDKIHIVAERANVTWEQRLGRRVQLWSVYLFMLHGVWIWSRWSAHTSGPRPAAPAGRPRPHHNATSWAGLCPHRVCWLACSPCWAFFSLVKYFKHVVNHWPISKQVLKFGTLSLVLSNQTAGPWKSGTLVPFFCCHPHLLPRKCPKTKLYGTIEFLPGTFCVMPL